MSVPLQITFHGMDSSPAIETAIRARADKLGRFHDRIVSCRVTVTAPHRHHHNGTRYAVHIDLTLPGAEIVTSAAGSEHAHEDPHVALRNAFAAATRQIEDQARRRRGDVKRHEGPATAHVIKLFRDDGYGFIETPDGLQIYFHENSVAEGEFVDLHVGAPVRFVLAEGEGAQGPQASTVVPGG